MRRILTFFWILLLLVGALIPVEKVSAEEQSYWVKTYGGKYDDWATAVAIADNGDVIVAGYTYSFGAGGKDVWVLRLDENGNVKWQKTYGGKYDDGASAVAIAPNGDIILVGYTKSFGAGGYDVWVLRLDENGNVKWQKTYGGSNWDEAHAVAIADNGDIIVTGSPFTIRLDANGNVIWTKDVGGNAVAIADNGDIIVAGSYGDDVWVLRLDENGNVKWQKTYGGSNWDEAHAVAIADNGDIIVAGRTYGFGAGGDDFWVLRLDENGNVKWQKTYGGSGSDWARAVAIAPNGDIIVAGYTYSFGAGSEDVWVLSLDENGNVKWQKTYGGSSYDYAYAVAIADNGDIIVAGYTRSFGAGYKDVWVLRLPSWGSIVGFSKDSNGFANEPSIQITDSNAKVSDSEAWTMDSEALEWSSTATITTVVSAGILEIFSNPGGAKVYIDNEYQGLTPLTVVAKSGTYTVKIIKANYNGYETTVTVAPGEVEVIEANLTQPPGTLEISSSPSGAKVYINGTYKGVTPLTLTMEPDTYVVTLVKEGYKEYSKTVVVYPGGTTEVYAFLEIAPALLKVESNPSEAEVYIDGTYIGVTPVGNYELQPGTYKVKLVKYGYQNYTTTITLKAGENRTLKVTLTPNYAHLTINSEPQSAEVYVNGTYKGVTPLTLELLTGNYSLKLTKEGYENYTAMVEVKPGETKTVSATLTPAYGFLNVDSAPSGAEVYINRTYIGTTPLENYKLPPGKYTITIKKEGYEEYTKSVNIISGKATTLSASLTVIPQPSSSTTTMTTSTQAATTPSSTSESKSQSTTTTPSSTSTKSSTTSRPISTTTKASSSDLFPSSPSKTEEDSGGLSFSLRLILGVLIGLIIISKIATKNKGGKNKLLTSPREEKPAQTPVKSKSPTPVKGQKQESIRETIPSFPPELLDKYEPLEFLGEGGFAKVFKAKRKKDGKIVAIKIPRIDEKTSSLFLKEIAAWYNLNHPNIVRLYKADILPIPYLEMEYVEGVNLNGKTIRDLDKYPKPVDEKKALQLIRGIAEGLKYAHSKGIYHNDLKPLNVLLKSDLTPKITDWGLAKISARSSLSTHSGYSPLYAAPEQLDESLYGTPDHRTDIYQLGVILYELLTGKLPYEGYSPGAVIGKILAENVKPLPPSKINPALAKYDGIFERLLAKRKEDRYQSVEEFLAALEILRKLEWELKELKKTKRSLKRSKSMWEIKMLRREAVEKTARIAVLSARLNDKVGLLNALEDLKVYTRENLDDLLNAINQVEVRLKEGIPVSDDLIERLEVLLHRIQRENEIS
ncbi:PEGA domain-containing protein [Thermococcus gammatolerans]|uniref:Serine/threonine protein kinase, putative S-layer protein n=1 Tax=Thermococcus gammatolerans (strain DSM 15229 / JCM 11827 / EJ3) TaxID=593117 RepID=C5A4Y9_THEGJ|nr:PEGA domain-containing protein [Thermococcus gammatolerans]ACS33301.1 Serine/threonine protein kinase, putative S-layer protein [Thermococcus gammatolerans EJ3]